MYDEKAIVDVTTYLPLRPLVASFWFLDAEREGSHHSLATFIHLRRGVHPRATHSAIAASFISVLYAIHGLLRFCWAVVSSAPRCATLIEQPSTDAGLQHIKR